MNTQPEKRTTTFAEDVLQVSLRNNRVASCDLRLFLHKNNHEDSHSGDERGEQKKGDERRNHSANDGSCLD